MPEADRVQRRIPLPHSGIGREKELAKGHYDGVPCLVPNLGYLVCRTRLAYRRTAGDVGWLFGFLKK